MTILWLMICAHALADYPLQGDFLARGKNHTAPLDGVPWRQCLAAHALIHGGAVTLVTGSFALGVLEAMVHAMIDYAKCAGDLTYNRDQALHVICKVAWFALLLLGFK